MVLERADGIRRARGVVATGWRPHRRDDELVGPHEPDQWPCEDSGRAHRNHPRPDNAGRTRSSARSRCRPSSSLVAVAAAGLARTTRSTPAGTRSSRPATWARRRRLTRLRTTALPTVLDTTKPTRGGRPARASVVLPWTTMSREPALAPAGDRSVAVKSALALRRCCAGSTAGGPQAESLVRPLLRRWAMIDRPARVRIRWRKPWVFARRRVLGWNVRLLTLGSPYLLRSRGAAVPSAPPVVLGLAGGVGRHRKPTPSGVMGMRKRPTGRRLRYARATAQGKRATIRGGRTDHYGTTTCARRGDTPTRPRIVARKVHRPVRNRLPGTAEVVSVPSHDYCCPYSPTGVEKSVESRRTCRSRAQSWYVDSHPQGHAAAETSGVRSWRMPT